MILAPPGGREELDYVRHIVKQTIKNDFLNFFSVKSRPRFAQSYPGPLYYSESVYRER